MISTFNRSENIDEQIVSLSAIIVSRDVTAIAKLIMVLCRRKKLLGVCDV